MNSPVTVWRSHKQLSAYLNKIGRLIVWTKILVAPSGFEHQVPYLVGIVDFGPSTGSGQAERLPLQIVDCEEKDLKINQKQAQDKLKDYLCKLWIVKKKT